LGSTPFDRIVAGIVAGVADCTVADWSKTTSVNPTCSSSQSRAASPRGWASRP
jgi:hypothetical protein